MLLIRDSPRTNLVKLPFRTENGNKGTFGRVLVIGGCDEMLGAPVMAGAAALRMGAGLVQIAVPKSILLSALSIVPELVGLALTSSNLRALEDAAEKSQAVILGPGMGQSTQASERVMKIIRLKRRMVVDADALNLISKLKRWPKFFKAEAILTPHPGEMLRLVRMLGETEVPTDDEGRLKIAQTTAKSFGQVLVLKGMKTVVTDGLRAYVNHSGDSSLAKAGTGDVLSGMIGALLAQNMDRFEAASLAVYLHGKAGELAGNKFGRRSVLAHDVVDSISESIAEFEKSRPT